MNGETQGDAPLHELFEEQARRTPEARAIVGPWGTTTYRELDGQTGRLAAHLKALGVGPDVTVGVYMERRPEFVVACLAALRAGGAFLPLELAYPDSMIEEVLADARPRVVVTTEEHEANLPEGQERLVLDGDWESALAGDEPGGDGPRPTLDSLAFVSYSSGTTGKPKGIANPHRAPVRSYSWRFGLVDYGAGDVVGCNVFFVWEMLRPLLRGGAVCPIPDDVIYDPAALVGYMAEHGVTEVLFTPSLLEAVLDGGGEDLAEKLSALRTLWLNGEVVTKTLARRALRLLPGKRIFNLYSISETHEVSAGELEDLVESADSTYCPVGKPADPGYLYVLDEDARPVEEGTAGELYVGGEGLARGYVNLPEKTAERFIPDPYAGGDAQMYRSGDRARILPDGNLEIMGRVDFMVKVRGYSIELGAVEAAIEERLRVTNCVVVAEGEEGTDKRLVAYLVPDPTNGTNDDRFAEWNVDPATGHSPRVRRVLQDALPHYMIPAVYVEVDALPLQDATGKVDRANLPEPPARGSEDAAPEEPALPPDASRPEKEDRLARIFERVLLLEPGYVRPEDDFFEAGGHSLAAAELVSRVEEAFGVRLATSEILESPTVAGLCDAIEARGRDEDGAGQEKDEPDPRADAVLEPGISPEGADEGVRRLSDAGDVFLTGATGFLGAFILDGLLTGTEARIHCLVRPRPGGAPMSPLRDAMKGYGLWSPGRAERIVPVPGDLTEPLLGLSQKDFDELAGEVDVVIHAGALVNLIYPYSALKPANVDGTREVLRLACRRKVKPVHHVSTNGVFGRGWGLCEEETDLDDLAGVQEDGYGRSKWVAEGLVREAAERGLPAAVYRPGNISGHSETGFSNPKDFLGAVISESVRVGSAPRINGWRMEMTPVDFVSGSILRLADDPGAAGKTFHLANPEPPPAERVFGWLEDLGYDLERPDYPGWLETLRSTPAETEAGEVVRGAAPDDAAKVKDDNDYDDRNTRRAQGEGGPRRPEVDAALLATYARSFAKRGWMPSPDREEARR